jgi:hypothetical protein
MNFVAFFKSMFLCFIVFFTSYASAFSDGEWVYASCELRTLVKYSSYRKAVIEHRDTFDYFDVVYLYKDVEDMVKRGSMTKEDAIGQITRFMQRVDEQSSDIKSIDGYHIWCDGSISFLLISYFDFDEDIKRYMRFELRNNRIIKMELVYEDFARKFNFTKWTDN